MSSDRPFVEALGDELYAAAVRQTSPAGRARRRRRRLLVPAGAITIGATFIAGILLMVARPNTAQADVRIERADGRVTVTLVDLEHRPRHIEQRVRAAGLDVSVTDVPVGPSEVGRFVGNVTTDLPRELRVIEGGPATFAGFSIPARWSGSLELQVGRPARAGEPYAAFSNAFARGEPLACTPLIGRPAAQSLAVLAARHLWGSFLAISTDPGDTRPVAVDDLRSSGLDDWVIVAADATSASHVLIRIQAEPPSLAGAARSEAGC